MRTHSIQILLTILATALIASLALGETLTLKDGTVLEGTVIKKGDVYWVKTRDGKTQEIPVADVAQVGSQSPGGTAPLGGDVFNATRRRAEACTNPTEAIAHWQKFIDANLDNSDLAAAESEMKKWQDFAEGGAEKIGGKWVGGEERKKILAKAQQLTREGFDLMQKDQTLQALKKLQEAAKVYPNSFQVNFLLGYLSMLQRKDDEAIKYFEQALRQRPNSPEALANIAIAYSSKKQHEKAINTLRRAAEAEDSQPIVQNLINAIYAAPPAMQRNAKIKPAIEAAQLLAAKYGISGPSQQFYLVPLKPESVKDENSGEAIGAMMSSGTGFLITDDGLILTN